jgi:2-hydroxychromene-2-carboxylate isomerase
VRIGLWFDFLSPYAYLAWHGIQPLAARHGATVVPEPVLLAALLQHGGQLGPAEIPAKRSWVYEETARRAAVAGLPFGPPAAHPFRPLLALRAVLAAPEASRGALIGRLFAEAWGGEASGGLDDPETVARRADEAGLDGEALVASTARPTIKEALRRQGERAIQLGVFGVPTMTVPTAETGGSVVRFWGYGSLDLLELHLQGADPLDPDDARRWSELPATAYRAR